MCGIAGIIDVKGVGKDSLIRFTDSLKHRGPDASGYSLLNEGKVGLGHRRLSILDLSPSGNQPMHTENERYSMVFNGEIFNYQEIKNELEGKGHSFKSRTDSEVVLHSYQEWGPACLDKFNGMWAIAIWDQETKQLFLARDRFGIKPLYYLEEKNRLSFASETLAFKNLDAYSRSFSSELLELNSKNVFALEGAGYTIFDDILQVLPGHYSIVSESNLKVKQVRWYDIREKKQTVPSTFEEQTKKFYDLFHDACKLRLISDVPVATALSGGLDSSSVFSMVRAILNENSGLDRVNKNSQNAYTAVFPGLDIDEKHFASKAAGFFGSNVNEIITEKDQLISRLENDTLLSDFISTTPITSISSVYKGMKSNGISVSLDGHGVDEMLFGYRDMVSKLFYDKIKTNPKEAGKYKDILIYLFKESDVQDKNKKFSSLVDQANAQNPIKKALKNVLKGKPKSDPIDFNLVKIKPELSDQPLRASGNFEEDLLKYEFFVSTLPTLLRNFDRAGMMNSVEIRMPFMDYRLVEYCFSLPTDSKIGKGFTKLILREAMKGKMDEEIRTRRFKVGIGSPFVNWLNHDVKDWAFDLLNDESIKQKAETELTNGEILKNTAIQIWKNLSTSIISQKT